MQIIVQLFCLHCTLEPQFYSLRPFFKRPLGFYCLLEKKILFTINYNFSWHNHSLYFVHSCFSKFSKQPEHCWDSSNLTEPSLNHHIIQALLEQLAAEQRQCLCGTQACFGIFLARFNMPHDDSLKCREDGVKIQQHVMAPMLNYNTNPWMWSKCSRKYITEFLEYVTAFYSFFCSQDAWEFKAKMIMWKQWTRSKNTNIWRNHTTFEALIRFRWHEPNLSHTHHTHTVWLSWVVSLSQRQNIFSSPSRYQS